MAVSVQVQGTRKVNRSINRLFNKVADLRPLFETLTSDFLKTEKNMIFRSGQSPTSSGKYADLRPITKRLKKKSIGRVYPVLDWSGRLKESLSIRGSRENITIIEPARLVLGTKVPYAQFLFKGTSKMVARPPIIMSLLEPRFSRLISTYFSRSVA